MSHRASSRGLLPIEQCLKCNQGQGIPPECMRICGHPSTGCLVAQIVADQATGSSSYHRGGGSPTGSDQVNRFSAERRVISSGMPSSIPKEDILAVWNLLSRVLSHQIREGLVSEEEATSPQRIEDVALLVARSADDWGHDIQAQTTGRAWKTQAEKDGLVRRASRIRRTALEISTRARAWGEERQRKRR